MTPAEHDWSIVPWRRDDDTPGCQIGDSYRGVTYRVTVNARSELDHLEVIIDAPGLIDDNAMRRVPVATIRRQALRYLAETANDEPGDITVVLPGGLRERPSVAEVADLMRKGYDRPALHAMFRDVPPRTVDKWMQLARRGSAI